jgi:hypothetical protein
MDKVDLTRLLQRYFANEATHSEREALFAELEKYKNNEDWVNIHTSLLSQAEEIKEYDPQRYQFIIDRVLTPDRLHGVSGTGPRVVPMYRRKAFRWIAAACLILVTGYGLWKVTGHRLQDTGSRTQVAKTHDVPAPQNTRAVITLANGQKVYLDSAGNGTIAQQNNVNVIKNANG